MPALFEPREVALRDGRKVTFRSIPPNDGLDIAGAASHALGNGRSGEFAMAVVDGWGGAGPGPELLAGPIAVAHGRDPGDFSTRLVTPELA